MNVLPDSIPASHSLDPDDWRALRAQGHQMLDDMFDYLASLDDRPVWQPIPDTIKERFKAGLPERGEDLARVHQEFLENILPYSIGNLHPAFMGWVQGGGTAVGMLAEMLAAGLNANVGGREQIPIEVEWQILRWVRELMGFPETASGLFVTGASMANLISLLVARRNALGDQVRQQGVAHHRLVAYASQGVHGCIAQAMDISGLGTDALRLIPVDDDYRLNTDYLLAQIQADREAGFHPFFVAATAGTVDVGAIDPLVEISVIAKEQGLWFHVDGAYGALGILVPDIAQKLQGIEQADSLAFDFHKWGQVPYDAGFVMIREQSSHLATFQSSLAYLSRSERGMAAGDLWPCDLGPDLSRSFKALKTWFTLRVYGVDGLRKVVQGTCALAKYLERRIADYQELELLAPVALNIVCFRFKGADSDALNARIVEELQISGIAAPSTTVVKGQLAIRAAIVNHRVNAQTIDAMITKIVELGKRLA